jgi:hypothetical protein
MPPSASPNDAGAGGGSGPDVGELGASELARCVSSCSAHLA